MIDILIELALAFLIFTTILLVVRTIVFQWSYGTVERVEGVPPPM